MPNAIKGLAVIERDGEYYSANALLSMDNSKAKRMEGVVARKRCIAFSCLMLHDMINETLSYDQMFILPHCK